MELNVSKSWLSIQSAIQKDGVVYLPKFGDRFGIQSPQDLSEVLAFWPVEWRAYLFGQSRRTKLAGEVYTASEYSPKRSFSAHHELSYTPNPPKWIVFYAHKGVDTGSMRLLDGRLIFESMQQSSWSYLLDQEIVYRKCMPSERRLGFGKTWQEHFEDSDPDGVSRLLDLQGVSYQWLVNGYLSIQYRVSFTREHTVGQVWYAQPRLWHLPFRGLDWFERSVDPKYWPTAVHLGSGERIPIEFLYWLGEQEQHSARRIQIDKGGMVIVDNHRVAHGREPYAGQREHWVTMGT